MSRIAAACILSFATLSLYADVGVKFQTESVPVRVPLHARVLHSIQVTKPAGTVIIEIDIPGDDVTIGADCIGSRPWRCTVSSQLLSASAMMNTPGTFTATARVIGAGDENPQNDQASFTFEVVDAPSLHVSAHAGRYDPASLGNVFISVGNGGVAAKDVVLTLTLPEGGTFTGRIVPSGAGVACSVTPGTIVCTLPELANRSGFSLNVEVATPERFEGGTVPVTASVRSSVPDFNPADDQATALVTLIRYIVVNNTNDEGAGSLRQALLDARQLCAKELCTVAFRIPGEGEGGRFVIRPLSELPELQGDVNVDGSTQTLFGGDTNPDGPEIVIDGSLAPPSTRGLVMGGPSCEMYVTDLAVVNFPAPGIQARRGPYLYQQCRHHMFPNTLIARNHLSGNYRGLAVSGEGYATIAENVISNNHRAGIFADRSAYVVILRNRVTGNGASGIFINPAHPYPLQAAVVEENVISGNAEWGIARHVNGDMRIRKNSIFGNRYLAIDAGLDLETPNVPEDRFEGIGIPNKPVLISAHYDPASGKTRVQGRLDSETLAGVSTFVVDVYASSSLSTAGQAEAEQWLFALPLPPNGGHTDFAVEVDGDLRGKFITATNTRRHVMYWDEQVYDTSEISNAIPVQ